jgi:hypothetical protein
MEKEFKLALKDMFSDDEDIQNLINAKCTKALAGCSEYLEKEYSGEYDDDELSVFREKECFNAGVLTGLKLAFAINKYSKII